MSIALNGDGIISGVSSISVGAGASVFSPAANTLAFGTNGVERFRVTSTGQLQATSASDVRLTLGSSGTAGTNDSNHIRGDGTNMKYMAASGGIHLFEINGVEAARFTSSGNLAFPSGQGIDFSATADGSGTTTSELLDDYEEGSWTPTLGNTGTITAGTAEGIYTKIGNVCIARVRIDNATFGGSPNDEIRGLPFTAQQRSTTTQVVHANAFTAETIAGLVIQSNTYISMSRNPTTGSGFWTGATIQTGTTKYIYCTLVYFVA